VTRPRATALPPDERRRAIIDAVVPLLVEHGPTITTRQIADAAGIAEGTIFRVFPDKAALLMATAAETVNPEGGAEAMALALADVPDLYTKLQVVIAQLVRRMEQGMLVMMALRATFIKEGHTGDVPPGPPKFILDANRLLLESLATNVFEPHRTELGLPPRRAALILRSLVFGTWHPGTQDGDRLTVDEIAEACLVGVTKGGKA
jgi:AcrR family transcriptional regulator